ncbi:MAG: Na+/H+ antiporter NhaA [Bryobacteraceae bacterium]|nr:Na+/H+ antiporter NhaA [Bryobacteraceae bacterium]
MQRKTTWPGWLAAPLETFAKTEALGGALLAVAGAVGFAWANSPWQAVYRRVWDTVFRVGLPGFELSKPLLLWINDLLMAIFFLLVGLEIKRELVIGELSSLRKAALPAAAALGGMIAPAAIFLALAGQPELRRGWGIPMATDIAFALGCLRVLGARVPASLLVLLTALAIMDDLGAILVIAIFYTADLSAFALLVSASLTAVLLMMNRRGVHALSPYLIAGALLWLAVLKSGVHATVAGVVLGLCLPARARFARDTVLREAHTLLEEAQRGTAAERDLSLQALHYRLRHCEAPLARLEHALHPWVAYGILPLFALANAGVNVAGLTLAQSAGPVALGVFFGLFAGKQLGVLLASWLAVKAGWTVLPEGVRWVHIYGMGLLAGIGFTMALFIAGLAYGEGTPLHNEAKIGILSASLASAISGLAVLALAGSDTRPDRR